jgi:transcriptional regulator with XRE-family HTH domain
VVFLDDAGVAGQAGGMTSMSSSPASGSPYGPEGADSSPAVQRRVLAGELKNLRRSAGLTHVDVANRLGWQQGKVSKIESAKQRVGVEAVIALAEVCDATPEQRDHLVGLARTAKHKGWWESYGDVLSASGRLYAGLEADAGEVRAFAVEIVPDLLQIADYSRAVLARQRRSDQGRGLERRLEVLLERQRAVIQGRAARVDAVVAESALRRVVGDEEVFGAQLRHLAAMAAYPHVRLRVLPFSAGAIPAVGPFTILRFAECPHPDIAFVPSQDGYTCFEQAAEVSSYLEAFRESESLALGPEESLRMLTVCEREGLL